MLAGVTAPDLLHRLETYYDAAPRPLARTEPVGPFTLFVKTHPDGWDFYARPRLGLDGEVTAADVAQVRDRQRALGVAQNLEWVHETTPSLAAAARADGMRVHACPLLVLAEDGSAARPRPGSPAVAGDDTGVRIAVLAAGSPDLARVAGAVAAGFADTDDVVARDPGPRVDHLRSGLLVMAGAYDARGDVVGGGSHSPRGTTTELTGIAVLPRARRRGAGAALTRSLVEDAQRRGVRTIFLSAQDHDVARVYERVGFTRVGTACIAEGAER